MSVKQLEYKYIGTMYIYSAIKHPMKRNGKDRNSVHVNVLLQKMLIVLSIIIVNIYYFLNFFNSF